MREVFSVPDVSCGHCKSTIEGALQPMGGIEQAAVDVDEKKVDVIFDDDVVTRDEVVAAIEDAGYAVAG
jgi:copper chaperone